VWNAISQSKGRAEAKRTILECHFSKDAVEALQGQLKINLNTTDLYQTLDPHQSAPKGTETPVRDRLFRIRIQNAYQHRCAFTGLVLKNPNDHTAIDCAHIRAWSDSHDDSVRNGMALSKLSHWAYDAGLITVNEDFTIKVANFVRSDQHEEVQHLLALHGQPIHLPKDPRFHPNPDGFAWHRENRFNVW